MRTYAGNRFICAFELSCIYVVQVRAYFIVCWNSSSFLPKKEIKPQINFYTRLSLLTHMCIVSNKAIARQNIWSIQTQGCRLMKDVCIWTDCE